MSGGWPECACGCGSPVGSYKKTNVTRGEVAGAPRKYADGHMNRNRLSVGYVEEDRGFDTPCWIWQGAKSSGGYGIAIRQHSGIKTNMAHRWHWCRVNGEVPDGMDLDHLCRVRACVNPDHLEPVTRAENIARGEMQRLTEDDVRFIRSEYDLVTDGGRRKAPSGFNIGMAKRFGIRPNYVSNITGGFAWAGR